VANKKLDLQVSLSKSGVKSPKWYDLIEVKEYEAASGRLSMTLEPYDVMWVKETRIPP